MPAVPETKATWTNDVDALDTTNLHAYVRDPLAFLQRKPAAVLRRAASQTIATANYATAIIWDTADLDDDPDGVGGNDLGSNPSRYTARYPGWYRVSGGVGWAASATGRRGCLWTINGTAWPGGEAIIPATAANQVVVAARSVLLPLAIGDYVELVGWQESGGNLATSTTSDGQRPAMNIEWARLLVP